MEHWYDPFIFIWTGGCIVAVVIWLGYKIYKDYKAEKEAYKRMAELQRIKKEKK